MRLLSLCTAVLVAACAQTVEVKVDCGPSPCPTTVNITVDQNRGGNTTVPTTDISGTVPLL